MTLYFIESPWELVLVKVTRCHRVRFLILYRKGTETGVLNLKICLKIWFLALRIQNINFSLALQFYRANLINLK